MSETEKVVDILRYGEEQFETGYREGLWNGMVAAVNQLFYVPRIGMGKINQLRKAVLEEARRLNIVPEGSYETEKWERSIRMWEKKNKTNRQEDEE